jgi:AcrR family transcriptional regulator
MTDGRLLKGERTRQAVLDTAVATASVEGLDGMSLARLAPAQGVSKSGLFAHWPDKRRLQLDVVEHAQRQWSELIVEPALREPRGVRRLWALHDRRVAFYEAGTLPGGCFFAAVGVEFDDHPGPVRDAIVGAIDRWLALLTYVAEQAVTLGELRPGTDPGQLAFEIQALGEAVVAHTHLLRREDAYRYARRAVADRLRSLATDPRLLPEALHP